MLLSTDSTPAASEIKKAILKIVIAHEERIITVLASVFFLH
jgi:hypothetical protein